MVGLNGLEPSTSRLSGVRSNQLSYRPITTIKYFLRNFKSLKTIYDFINSEVAKRWFFLLLFLLRKEVIHPHVLVGIPCYDLTPIICPTLDGSFLYGSATGFGYYKLSWFDGRCVQSPRTYSPRHSDSRLLAIPTS